jgi:hypothetical protein
VEFFEQKRHCFVDKFTLHQNIIRHFQNEFPIANQVVQSPKTPAMFWNEKL